MNSRDGFPQTGADEVRISPSSGAADRAAQAYEKAFLESAHSNESKLRLLEERMKRPQSTAQMSDAVRAGAPEPHSDDDDDDDEQRGFGVHYSHPEKKQRRGSGRPRVTWAETLSPRPPRLPTVLSAVSRASKLFPPARRVRRLPGAAPLHHPRAPRRNRAERKPSPGKRRSRRRRERRAAGSANRADHEWAAALEQARAEASARRTNRSERHQARVGSRVSVFQRRRPTRRTRRPGERRRR